MRNRFELAASVTASILEGNPAWHRNAFEVPGAVEDWVRRMPGVPMVDDGETMAGRGTTAMDLVRRVETSSLIRFDWLSIKTSTIGKDKKLPSKISLSTGTPALHASILNAYSSGTRLPTLIYCASKGSTMGEAIVTDLSLPIRQYGVVPIEDYPEEGYQRGQAPPVYFKWSSFRPSGVKRAETLRALGVPDQGTALINGCLWSGASVAYPELVISLYAIGVGRKSWVPVAQSKLSVLLDHPEFGFPW